MLPNLHAIYKAAEKRSQLYFWSLVAILIVALIGVVVLSPSLVIASMFAFGMLILSFIRPTWALAALLLFLPFEPFLLKWIPDEVYIFARYASELQVYLLCLVVAVKAALGDIKLKRSPLDLPFILFILVLLASTLINAVPAVIATLGTRQIIRFILLYFVTVQLAPSFEWRRYLVKGLLLIAGFQISLGLAQFIVGTPLDEFLLPAERRTFGELQLTTGTAQFWDPGARIFGTMGRYDQLGTFLAMILILVVAYLYEQKLEEGERSRWLIFLILGLVALALTFSRSAWFGFLLGSLLIGVAIKKDRILTTVSLVVPALLLAYLSISGLVVRNLLDSPNQTLAERFFETFSADRWRGEYIGLGRVYWVIQTVATVVPASPLFGFGPGQYGGGAVAALANTRVYDELGLPFGVYGTGGYIDNNWMSLWGEVGTLGLLAYFWMLASSFSLAFFVFTHSKDKNTRTLALASMGVILAVAFNAFLALMFEVRTLAPYLWVIIGLLVSQAEREKLIE